MATIQTLNPTDVIKETFGKINTSVTNLNNAKMEKTADSELNMNGFDLTNVRMLQFGGTGENITISNGSITVTKSYHVVDTEGGAGSDDLDNINGGSGREFVFIRQANSGRTIRIRNQGGGTGNIRTPHGTDLVMSSSSTVVLLVRTGNNWSVVWGGGLKPTGDTMTGKLDFLGSSRGLTFQVASGDAETIAELVDFPAVSTANAFVRFFRQTNTTGRKSIQIHKGDGTVDLAFRIENGYIDYINGLNVTITAYAGNPNGNVAAPPGSICLNTSGGAGSSLYVKESGTGNTGWVAK